MRRPIPLLMLPVLLCLPARAQQPAAAVAGEELGLSKGSVFEVAVPDAVQPEISDPGDKPSPTPEYQGSPPRIPHGIADFLPITRHDNLCVDCHGIAEAEEGDPTPIPASHYIDWRRAPERVGEAVAGARWVCVSCHVTLSAAQPLVGNRFQARTPD